MKKTVMVTLVVLALGGMLMIHPALAHNFVQNSDASLVAKIQEFKVESKLIASNVSNKTLSKWHVSQSQQYWGSNEIGVLSQKDSNLANQISTAIDDLYSYANQPNPDPTTANQKANAVNNLLDQAESEQVSSSSQNNATVQALATVYVINEVLKDYGTAIGSKVDLTNMNNMNMSMPSSSGMQGMSGGTMSGMSSSGGTMSGMSSSGGTMSGMSSSGGTMSGMSNTPIVNMAAYQSAQSMTVEAQTMSNNLQSLAPSSASVYLNKVGAAITDLKQKIDAQASGNDVMMVVHMNVHPNLISAFNIQAVPEFPVPVLLIMASFVGVIAMFKIFYRNR